MRWAVDEHDERSTDHCVIDTSGMEEPDAVRNFLSSLADQYAYPVAPAAVEYDPKKDGSAYSDAIQGRFDRIDKLLETIPEGKPRILRRNENEIVLTEAALNNLGLARGGEGQAASARR